MNLYIKQRIFTWGDKFSVYDEAGNERYYVEGEILTFGKKLHLYDLRGNELAYIEQQLFTFLPKYMIYRGGEEFAEVVKEFTFFHPEYTVNGKECLLYTFDSQLTGTIKEVTEGAIMLESDNTLEAVNLAFIVRIREYPRKKNGKKKSVILD